MKATPEQIQAATQWARANAKQCLTEQGIDWAAFAGGMITAALATGEPHVQERPILDATLGDDGAWSI